MLREVAEMDHISDRPDEKEKLSENLQTDVLYKTDTKKWVSSGGPGAICLKSQPLEGEDGRVRSSRSALSHSPIADGTKPTNRHKRRKNKRETSMARQVKK